MALVRSDKYSWVSIFVVPYAVAVYYVIKTSHQQANSGSSGPAGPANPGLAGQAGGCSMHAALTRACRPSQCTPWAWQLCCQVVFMGRQGTVLWDVSACCPHQSLQTLQTPNPGLDSFVSGQAGGCFIMRCLCLLLSPGPANPGFDPLASFAIRFGFWAFAEGYISARGCFVLLCR